MQLRAINARRNFITITCAECKKEVEFPVKECAFGLGDFCFYSKASNALVFKEKKLGDTWEAIEVLSKNNMQWGSLQKWRKTPQNGPFLLQCLNEAIGGAKQPQTEERSSTFLEIIETAKLSYSRVGFGEGYWSFGFDQGKLDEAVASLRQMVLTVCEELKAPSDVTKELIKAYFGEDDFNIVFLAEQFEEIKGTIVSGSVKDKRIVICKGASSEASKNRTYGYVRPIATENELLGNSLSNLFRCIYLTDACFTGNDSDIEVDQKWFLATTLLHEMTHLQLKTEDRETAKGSEAYGRGLCAILRRDFIIEAKIERDPCSNADSLAYFACDLTLIKKGVINKAPVLKLLDL